mmetsp:Transcript_22720/g.76767  ORF Transcript_22720/g.76767 Transcript_22720/m.76767 type:complete len:267 (+) Transcript_22720:986-1786(+)
MRGTVAEGVDAHRQAARGLLGCEELQVCGQRVQVVDAREPLRKARRKYACQRSLDGGQRRQRHQSLNERDGKVGEDARRGATGVAQDAATRRVRRLVGDAGELQRRRVDPGGVARDVVEEAGLFERRFGGGVEVLRRGEFAVRPLRVVPRVAEEPRRGVRLVRRAASFVRPPRNRHVRRPLGHGPRGVGGVYRKGEVGVHAPGGLHGQVRVRVDETRHHRRSTEVHHLQGAVPGERGAGVEDVCLAPHRRQGPARVDAQGLGKPGP